MDLTQQLHDDPSADGAARSAQLAAMVLSITEAATRLRAERLAGRAVDDERAAAGLRAQHRAEQAVAWLTGRSLAPGVLSPSGPAVPSAPAAPSTLSAPSGAGPGPVTIICTPRDLADQAFPVAMPEAMATARQAARDAVRALPAGRPRSQLTAGPDPAARSTGVIR